MIIIFFIAYHQPEKMLSLGVLNQEFIHNTSENKIKILNFIKEIEDLILTEQLNPITYKSYIREELKLEEKLLKMLITDDNILNKEVVEERIKTRIQIINEELNEEIEVSNIESTRHNYQSVDSQNNINGI